MPTTSSNWSLPAPQLTDGPPDIEQAVVPLRDRLEVLLSTFQQKPVVISTSAYSALPTSPVDGQEVLIRYTPSDTAVTPVLWRLRYDATLTSIYKWKFMAGQPLYRSSASLGAATLFSNQTYSFGWVDRGDPITAPYPGDWMMRVQATVSDITGLSTPPSQPTNPWNVSVKVGSTVAGSSERGWNNQSVIMEAPVSVASANSVVKPTVLFAGNLGDVFSYRIGNVSLSLLPIRFG
jgi:hypothetical protein